MKWLVEKHNELKDTELENAEQRSLYFKQSLLFITSFFGLGSMIAMSAVLGPIVPMTMAGGLVGIYIARESDNIDKNYKHQFSQPRQTNLPVQTNLPGQTYHPFGATSLGATSFRTAPAPLGALNPIGTPGFPSTGYTPTGATSFRTAPAPLGALNPMGAPGFQSVGYTPMQIAAHGGKKMKKPKAVKKPKVAKKPKKVKKPKKN